MLDFLNEIETGKIAILIPFFVCALVCLTIIVASLGHQWRRAKEAELNASLKAQMLEQGRSPEEIAQVLEAGTKRVRGSRRHEHHGAGC